MDTAKLISLVRSCVDSNSLKRGKLIHQKVITSGLQNNIVFCKSLINFYVSCQAFGSSKQVFQTIENPLDISLWNGLMAAYTKNYMFVEALELFDRLLHCPCIKPDCYTYPSALKACSGLRNVEYGRMIHSHVVKSGFACDIVVSSSVVGLYAKCDMFGLAAQLFDEMSEKDVASWNAIISGYYQSGQYEQALELFERMKGSGFDPNSVTFTTVVSACARLLNLERGKEIHGELTRNGFELDGFVSAALVDMYGKCGCLEMALEIFNRVQVKSLVSWNSMISAYSLKGDSKLCIELLYRMNQEGIRPSSTTLSSLLIACSKSAQLQHGKFIHGYIVRNDIEMDIFIYSLLIDLYFKGGNVVLAENVFARVPKTNVVAWNVMISGYILAGFYFEALSMFNEIKETGVQPDAITLTSILSACSQLATLEQGKEIDKFIKDNNFELNEIVMGALLDMYSKCGSVNEAYAVFNQLPENKRDLMSWTSMIMAFGSNGQALEALQLFRKMLQTNVRPDRVTFLAVISACSHAGLVDDGLHYFNLMVMDYNIQPTAEDYAGLLDLLGRAGRLHEAYEILHRIPKVREDAGLLSTFLCACHVRGELELGEEVARSLIEKNPDDLATYIILAKIYASAKKWDEVRKVRYKMKEIGLKKHPGCSWIEVDKRVQTFFAKDKLFPLSETIYDCLSVLSSHMEDKLLLG